MVTEQWLEQAAKLLECQQFDGLLQQFLETLALELGLDNHLFLAPGFDGRELKPLSCLGLCEGLSLQALCLAVTDFRHPFAHVLQTGEAMLLNKARLAYWQEHSGFVSLCDRVGKEQALLLFPLSHEGHVRAILCLRLAEQQGSGLLVRQDWQQYAAVFMRHWQLLDKLLRQNSDQSQLSSSLDELRRQQQQHDAMQQLGKNLVGDSQAMSQLRQEIVRGAASQLSVLVQGETGTGKELVARAIHDFSERSGKPFVAINCAAIPENLLESELFGYAKGAFSGADKDKQGLIAQAHQGTLFLDEIGDMPLNLQSKLLRVLETGHYRALGGNKEIYADFRLVAATHVNLKEQIHSGEFRRDLFYRLCQFPLHVPALRERLEDIPDLAAHFIALFNQSQQRQIPGIRFSALNRLKNHGYPGNVRELRNMLDYACALTADGVEIDTASLPATDSEMPKPQLPTEAGQEFEAISDLRLAVAQFERAVISARLKACNGDRAKAAVSLGMPKRTFSHKCQKLEINE
ncbi:sigma-54 interaction domain-containing protein [Shewanella algae]|uniref:sigma-54 interaction domain-containing protein n=1 Tax=Shewanella algae TaxID=38313 RepID=UPI001AAFCE99|nr:sigma-54 dependent transcriptional regulator [Shewanella algae]MBO2695107.1 sigma-54-dependent Fis family transcriptional regulator [Shewanella algae]